MSFLPSLPTPPHLADVFKRFPETVPPLLDYHDRLLRGPSPFSIAERELIAAYVSGLNACEFCFGSHVRIAGAFDVAPETLDALIEDMDAAPVDPRLRPVLAYVRALTLTPARVTETQVRAILDAGWPEEAVFHAASVCALFNFMNRIVDGLGVRLGGPTAPTSLPTKEAMRERTYTEWGRQIGVVKD